MSTKQTLEEIINLAQAEIRRIDGVPDDNTAPDENNGSDKILLEYFQYANGKVVASPVGLPSGMRIGIGDSGGNRTVQWELKNNFILHAVFPSSCFAIPGTACKWYHFTQTGHIHPGLSHYGWVESKSIAPWSRFLRYA